MTKPLEWSVRIDGLKELEGKLVQLGPKVGRKVVAKAVAKGARIVKNDAIAHAPMRTGVLKRAIYVKHVSERSTPWSKTYIVGVRRGKKYQAKGKDAFYFPWVEFRSKHSSRDKPNGERFMTNAFKNNSQKANDVIIETLFNETMKLAEKKT